MHTESNKISFPLYKWQNIEVFHNLNIFLVSSQSNIPYKFYVLGQIVSANSADQDQTASEEAV